MNCEFRRWSSMARLRLLLDLSVGDLLANQRIGMTESIPEGVYLLSLLADERCGGRHGKGMCASSPIAPNANSNRASNQIVARLFTNGVNAQGAKVMSMNEDRFAGTAKNVGGRVEQGFGRATGDVKTEVEGKFKQATGAAQDAYGQAKDAAGEAYGQAKDAVGDAARSVQEQAAPLEEFLRNAIEKSAVYLGGCRAGHRLVHRPHGADKGEKVEAGLLAPLSPLREAASRHGTVRRLGDPAWATDRARGCGVFG